MMKSLRSRISESNNAIKEIKPFWFLLIGVVTMMLAHLTYSIDLAGWVSMVPFLVYLNITKGIKSRLTFTLALIAAWSGIVFKIITPPIPYFFIFLYSIPIGLLQLPGYLVWAKYKNKRFSIFLFPAMMVLMEWMQYTFTPLGSWGNVSYTQTHSIIIMQFLSIFGMAGFSFLIYWTNVAIAEIIVTGRRSLFNFILPIAVLGAVVLFGAIRFEFSKSRGEDTILVAAIGTDSRISGLPLTPKKSNEADIAAIFKRTRKAAELGARIVVWNEAAFYLEPAYEMVWIDSMRQLAIASKVTLIASYVLPISESPFKFENKYLLIDSHGEVINTYLKHQPVPGEPAIKGTSPLQTFEVEGSRLGGAICYDYDFPYLAKAYGKLRADIVAVPSSDWRGIDPLHTRMAAFRAVEQGHSVVRSTRFGLSAAITPYGEMIAQMSSFDTNNQIMISHLPKQGLTTIYSVIGDIFIYLCLGFIVIFLVLVHKLSK